MLLPGRLRSATGADGGGGARPVEGGGSVGAARWGFCERKRRRLGPARRGGAHAAAGHGGVEEQRRGEARHGGSADGASGGDVQGRDGRRAVPIWA
jgi:hypothetical protein